MKVPFFDLEAAHRELRDELEPAILGAARSGHYVLTDEVASFEDEFAAFCGTATAVGVGNGLDALRLTLKAWGVGAGDEVIVPAFTFVATWLAVSANGATVVPVEPDPATYTIDPARIESAVTQRTKAIVAVHLYGLTCDMEPIMEIGRRRRIRVLEDAAQAHGATAGGRRAGSLADAAAWSFYPSKNLGAYGDGGAVTTDDEELAERVRLLGNYGSRQKYAHLDPGATNSRLDGLQAAILRVKLRHLDRWNQQRNAIVDRYRSGIEGCAALPPPVPDGAASAWHQFVVRVADRDGFRRRMADAGVETMIHYPIPPHRQVAYEGLGDSVLPVTERLSGEVVSLPLWPQMADAEVAAVVAAVRASAGPA